MTKADMPFPKRLSVIHTNMGELIRKYSPDSIAFEELFSGKNVKNGHTGCAGERRSDGGGPLTPARSFSNIRPCRSSRRLSVTGHAEKKQIQEMVRLLLGMKEIIKPDDAADAVACAICHAHSSRYASAFRIK